MGDRVIVYPGEIMQDYHILYDNKYPYVSIAKLAGAIIGNTQIVNGFACSATVPAGMTLNIAPGEIYSLQNIDNTEYGTIALDQTHEIVKQGIILNTTNISCPAPTVAGTSINYLIQAVFLEQDSGSTVLPYYNPSNITSPYSGPGNNNQPQNTIRQNTVTISVLAGVAATTGTQTTPNPSTNNTGLWVVTVAYGATSITSSNFIQYSSASFIQETLPQKISQPTADLRYGQIISDQNGTYQYAVDTSVSANTITASLNPAIAAYTAGLPVRIKIANTNTGASTANLNGLGAKNILLSNGGALNPGDLFVGQDAEMVYNGTNFQLNNPCSILTNGYAVDSGTANTYEISSPPIAAYYVGFQVAVQITNTNTGASTLAVNSLSAKNIIRFNGLNVAQNDLYAGMIARFQYNGTAFVLLNPATSNCNVLFAYVSFGATTQQTISASNVPTLVQFNNVIHDPNSWWTGSSTYKFTPNVAGLFRATWVLHSYNTTSFWFFSTLYKNGSKLVRGAEAISNLNVTSPGGALFQMNGTTDFVQLYANCDTASGATIGYDTVENANITNAFFLEYVGSYI